MKTALQIGFVTTAAGITSATLAHYLPLEVWPISYAVSVLAGILVAAIYSE